MSREGATRCARSPRKPRSWCANTRAPTRASTATGWCARSGWAGSSGRGSPAFESQGLFDPAGILNPGKIVRPSRMDDRTLFRFRPGYKTIDYKPALDWSAWNVENDPLTEALTAPGSGGDRRRLRQGRRDVQQQRPLPQVRRRHHVPVLPRHARRGAPHARPRQYAAPRAVGPASRGADVGRRGRGARPVRLLQGLQARLPDRRRHGAHEDRGEVGAPHEQGPHVARPADRQPAALSRRGRGGCPGCSTSPGSCSPLSASPSSARCRSGAATRSSRPPMSTTRTPRS